MTVQEFFQANAEQTGRQVRAVFLGFEGGQWEERPTPQAMSPRETLSHLCECYVAALKLARGEKHAWGTYSTDETDPERLRETLFAMRAEAVQAAVGTGDPDVLAEAFTYIHEHDAYHVGQLCLLRARLDPDWDPYSIYRS